MDKFIVFAQNQSLFAIDLTTVREVLFLSEQQITPVPNTLPFLLGLTNLRGEILAVADFGRSIGTESTHRSHPQSRILVLEAPDPRDVKLPLMRVGLAVSSVEGVQSINSENIVSAEEVSAELAPLLRGLYNLQGRLLMIVDVEAIANSDRW
jgi:purine-binding chemotaxis protein CheW